MKMAATLQMQTWTCTFRLYVWSVVYFSCVQSQNAGTGLKTGCWKHWQVHSLPVPDFFHADISASIWLKTFNLSTDESNKSSKIWLTKLQLLNEKTSFFLIYLLKTFFLPDPVCLTFQNFHFPLDVTQVERLIKLLKLQSALALEYNT